MTAAEALPTGTVTFLFSDIEGSTRLVQRLGDRYPEILERHQEILRSAFVTAGGTEVGTEGDSFFVVFPGPRQALEAAVEAQRALERHPWPGSARIRVRIGLHTGEGVHGAGSYVGVDVHRAARIAAAGHGGQVLISDSTRALVEHALPDGVTLHALGSHRLKDLLQPERIFQLVHPDLQTEFPPLATLSRRPNNLPMQTSQFLGRDAELRAVRELLDAETVRLVTLTGPGGIGKTRLALQSAADRADRFDDGVFFVDLAPARDVDPAFEAVVRAVGATRTADRAPLTDLEDWLESRHSLLLLDNFEQVMEAADGVAQLLQRCPHVRALITSREALRVRGERVVPVPALGLPDGPLARIPAAQLEEVEAVRLFVDRARAAQPTFALTDENAGAVVGICARVDGLPLAIELAAARLQLFSPQELRDRLRDRLETLGGGPRDLPSRQRTLQSTIGWSYELLDDGERAVFRLLSLFSSARVDAVQGVARRVEALGDVDVLDRLASLVDKSLVRSLEDHGSRRLTMLETIREYASRMLDAEPDGADARRAHAEYFADLADGVRDRLEGSGRAAALDDLAADLGNLMTAWRHWVDAGDLERLDMLLDGLWTLHDARGWYHGALELTNDLLRVLSAIPSSPDRAREEITLRTSLARGLMALRGYTEEVAEAYGRALALVEEAGGLPERFPVLRSLASLHLYRAEFDKGAAVGRQLLDLAEQQDDVGLQVEGHLRLGANLVSMGDVESGLAHLERAIALIDPDRPGSGRFRLGPSPNVTPYTTTAFFLWLRGYPDRAVERADRALDVARRLNEPYTMAYALFHVGFLDLWRREWQLVHERASGVLEIAAEHDYHVWTAIALVLDGAATTALGRPEDGIAASDRGIALYRGMKTPPVFWPLLLCIRASTFALAGRPAEGMDAVDEAIRIVAGRGNILYPEMPLLKGDLLLAGSDTDGAATWYRTALDVAVDVQGRMSELRAATRLARLTPSGQEDTVARVRAVYDTFTEGLDSPDLVEARAVLDGS